MKGTPVEAEMIERRRRYEWVAEQGFGNSVWLPIETDEMRLEENAAYGEMGAIIRHMHRNGLVIEPPAGWTPKDPRALLLPEDYGALPTGAAGDRAARPGSPP